MAILGDLLLKASRGPGDGLGIFTSIDAFYFRTGPQSRGSEPHIDSTDSVT